MTADVLFETGPARDAPLNGRRAQAHGAGYARRGNARHAAASADRSAASRAADVSTVYPEPEADPSGSSHSSLAVDCRLKTEDCRPKTVNCESCNNRLGAGVGVGAACRFAAVGNDRVGWNLDRMVAGVCGLTQEAICRDCRARIVFVRHPISRKACPLEWDAERQVWVSHFATCPAAGKNRRSKTEDRRSGF